MPDAPSAAAAEKNGEEILPGVSVAPTAVRFQFARSRGPGGQNVNKVNSKAELWVRVDDIRGLTDRAQQRLRKIAGKRLTAAGEIHIAADEERSQEGNRLAALVRLRALLAAATHEPKLRRKTKPTRASQRRRVESKRHRSQIKSRRNRAEED